MGLSACAGAAFLLGFASSLGGLAGPQRHRLPALEGGVVLMLAALTTVPLLLPPVRRGLARLLPIDPDSLVHATALVYSVLLVGIQAFTQISSDVLGDELKNGPVLHPLDLVLQEAPFLTAALVGVGIFQRRTPAQAAARLGWVRPAWWHLALGLAAAGAFYAFSGGLDQLATWLTPELSRRVNAANSRLFGGLSTPVGIATLALAAGIAEEALFRGAMQPRLGIVVTSLVFASVHTQYGISLDTLAVFLLSCALGLIRRYTSTTASTITHVAYNALVGVGLGSGALLPTLGVEAALLLAAGAGLAREVRARSAAAGS